jgi:hypothetical protein
MKFLVEIPDDTNVTAEEVREAVCFGFGYWSDMAPTQLDAITVTDGVALDGEQR